MVDVCRQHGVWLEADALARIVDWIQRGGLIEVNQRSAAELSDEVVQGKSEARAEAALIERNIQLPKHHSQDSDEGSFAGISIGRIIRLGLAAVFAILAGLLLMFPTSDLARSICQHFGRHHGMVTGAENGILVAVNFGILTAVLLAYEWLSS